LGPEGKEDWRKFCMSVGLLKVKVGLVCRVMKTLLELMLVAPDCERAVEAAGVGVGGETGVGGFTTGAGVGAMDWQVEGCPEHLYPL
jgi:hypothetical protein